MVSLRKVSLHKIVPVLGASVLTVACAQPLPSRPHLDGPETAVAREGLQSRSANLDQVAAAFAFDLSNASVYVAPIQVQYRERSRDVRERLHARDFEFDARERERLQRLMEGAFAERFLQPRNSRLATSPAEADYRLQLRLEDFALSAPLEPPTWTQRTLTEQSAYGVLAGELYDRDGKLVMQFRDRRDIGENPGSLTAGGQLQQFSGPVFWGDMRADMRRAFSSLDRALR
ncbi:hypothetical protein [Microbulbifer yueqingensis]|uniref:DUF3313 domain-containing protein n=1 Tax=Microbulbifer yueqingensis TaxID=658219 RepID=A0A1G8YA79_9GAMM|nr:hypothetical protein [Microbulbifer yueqingensis]SDJ99583.1 hypothetical protein SAMN05216212_1414 [Microbulbifer yueqingensis]